MKLMFLRILSETFDVRQLTLFPDLDGFCKASTEHVKRWDNERW
ncbi:blue (Type 1) copper domain protein [Enterobacter hormaechei]|nr:blue (Type 1) copper domain protein [Enterobacter hormaechei]